jgi:hypothetical protein
MGGNVMPDRRHEADLQVEICREYTINIAPGRLRVAMSTLQDNLLSTLVQAIICARLNG